MTAWVLQETTLCMFFYSKTFLEITKHKPSRLSKLLPACQRLGQWTALEAGEIQDDTSLFSNVCVRSLLSPGVGFKADIKARITKGFQIQPTVRSTVLVQTCGIASGQSSCDEPLTEMWMLICYSWKGMELRNPEQTVEEDHPSADGLENFLHGWLL